MAARLTIVVFLCRITIHRPLQYLGSGLGPNSYHVASYCFFDKKHSSNYNWSRLGGGELGSGLLYFTNNSFQFVSQTELALAVHTLSPVVIRQTMFAQNSNQQKYPERFPVSLARSRGELGEMEIRLFQVNYLCVCNT